METIHITSVGALTVSLQTDPLGIVLASDSDLLKMSVLEWAVLVSNWVRYSLGHPSDDFTTSRHLTVEAVKTKGRRFRKITWVVAMNKKETVRLSRREGYAIATAWRAFWEAYLQLQTLGTPLFPPGVFRGSYRTPGTDE